MLRCSYNHVICNIGLQALGVPLLAIKLMLLVLQTMSFWLRTAYGVAKKPFGGTLQKIFMGLGQGNGAAPPAFLALSILMINAYKEMGNSCVYTSCFTGAVFVHAVIIYVDDTDLLLCAQDPDAPDEIFFQAIQKAINDWAMIVMATGGSLKPSKCHVSVNSYKFRKGRAVLKKTRELPKTTFTVPQKDGPTPPIVLLEPTEAKKTLGIETSTSGCGKIHLQSIREKGLD